MMKNQPPDLGLRDRYRQIRRAFGPAQIDQFGDIRTPDFLCVGSEKAGTTWLWKMLRRHPDIGLTAKKELRYFAQAGSKFDYGHLQTLQDLLENRLSAPMKRQAMESLATEIRLLCGGDRSYLANFGAMTEQVVGEVSPQYLLLKGHRLNHLKSIVPDAKIIVMVRDPVDRALSGGKMLIAAKQGVLDDASLLAESCGRLQLAHSRYSANIERFERAFDGRVHVGFYDDISASPQDLLRGICRFLGVEHDAGYFPHSAKKFNVGQDYTPDQSLKDRLYGLLQPEYDALARRYPERVAVWRALYER
jgi:hypothetical protein